MQYFFKVLKTNFTFNAFSILLIPRGNPVANKYHKEYFEW